MKQRFWHVDAFADQVFRGNPACVMLPETPLPDTLMQRIAAEHQLSETAFAVPEGDCWRLRWFTPTVEVELCGHATLATAFVLAKLGHAPPFRFLTLSGELRADVRGAKIELDFPARAWHEIEPIPELVRAIGRPPLAMLQSADPIAVLASADAVRELRPDLAAIREAGGSLIVTASGGDNADVTSRYFAPGYGIDEDPVTGSLHTQIVPYWAEKLGRLELSCHQASARGGRMRCRLASDRVKMAGTAVLYAEGVAELPS